MSSRGRVTLTALRCRRFYGIEARRVVRAAVVSPSISVTIGSLYPPPPPLPAPSLRPCFLFYICRCVPGSDVQALLSSVISNCVISAGGRPSGSHRAFLFFIFSILFLLPNTLASTLIASVHRACASRMCVAAFFFLLCVPEGWTMMTNVMTHVLFVLSNHLSSPCVCKNSMVNLK